MSHQDDDLDEKSLEIILDAVTRGVTLKEIHNISDGQMDTVYGLAYEFYNQGRLEEAERYFRFLCIYDFYCVDFIMGLAAVYQLQGKFQEAADLYAVAFAQSDGNFAAMLYAGQCQLSLGRAGRARQCFELVIEHSEVKSIVDSARAYMKLLGGCKPGSTEDREGD